MAKIEFVETTVFDGDVYIEIWSEDKHYSFLAEDVLDAMNAKQPPAVDLAGLRRKVVTCVECGRVNFVELYDPPSG